MIDCPRDSAAMPCRAIDAGGARWVRFETMTSARTVFKIRPLKNSDMVESEFHTEFWVNSTDFFY
jgi:hypothetical protein